MKTVSLKKVNRLAMPANGSPEATKMPVQVPALDLKTLRLRVRGKTPLIVHAWSEKAVREMLDKQMGVPRPGRGKKDPLKEFRGSLYYLPGKKGLGIPSPAFKGCIVSGANDVDEKMTEVKRAIHVNYYTTPILAPPLAKTHWTEWDHRYIKELAQEHEWGCGMRMDLVRLSNGEPDLRFRGWFPVWEAELEVEYNAKLYTADQVANLFHIGGWGCGVAEWRPSAPECRTGEFGRFEVV